MVQDKIKLNCGTCSQPFEKVLSEYNHKIRNGRESDKFYCSVSCAMKAVHAAIVLGSPRDIQRCKNLSTQVGAEKSRQVMTKGRFNWYLTKSRNSAKRREGDRGTVNLTEEYLIYLWDLQNGCCAWSGIPMQVQKRRKLVDYFSVASLDRIDSSLGYTEGNVQFVCLPLNLAKGNKTDQEMLAFLTSVNECYKKKHAA